LIFCRSKDECDHYAQLVNCNVFYASTKNKDKVLKSWKSGPLFATGSLGAGVNIKNVHWVFHLGLPYGLIHFDQESGRGGRAGEEVESLIMLTRTNYTKCFQARPESLPPNERAMREFVIEKNCLRVVRSRWMNGNGEAKSCDDLEACKRCGACRARDYQIQESSDIRKRNNWLELPESSDEDDNIFGNIDSEDQVYEQAQKRRRVMQRIHDIDEAVKDDGERRFQLEQKLNELQNKCEVCWTINELEGNHTREQCGRRNDPLMNLIKGIRSGTS